MSYTELKKLKIKKFEKKQVLLIGTGRMGTNFANALLKLGIHNVTVISRSNLKTKKFCKKFGFKPELKQYTESLSQMKKMDLVIIASPIEYLIPITKVAIKHGQNNILMEKPGSLDKKELLLLKKLQTKQRIRVAYNRLAYTNFQKLKELIKKDGGISSCKFTVTEIPERIPLRKKNYLHLHKKRGIYATSHVLSLVVELIGKPKTMTNFQKGKFSWHPTGSIFVGSGVSDKNIPFSYHGDWNSKGGWSLEIMTKNNVYRLGPIEELFVNTDIPTVWKRIATKKFAPKIKDGIVEQVAIMLDRKLEKKIPLIDLEKAILINEFAEKIFGYKSK